jgi:hypothetical protein
MVLSRKREIQFEKDEEYKKYYIEDQKDAVNFFAERPEVFVITSEHNIDEVETDYGYSCSLEYETTKVNLYLCAR